MKLVPTIQTIDADWGSQGAFGERWALVGNRSGYIHCMFDAGDIESARKILDAYNEMRECWVSADDSYDLYAVSSMEG